VPQAAIVHPVQLALVRSLSTWSILSIMNVPYAHFATLAVGVTAFIPIIPPVLTLAPWVISDFFANDESTWTAFLTGFGMRGAGLLVVSLIVLPGLATTLDGEVYKNTHSYAMSLALYAGFTAWGIPGIILGPICMLSLVILYNVHQPLAAASSKDDNSPKSVESETKTDTSPMSKKTKSD